MNRIKQLRDERKLHQIVLAEYLGLEVAAISKLETGRVPLKDEYIIKLADFFDVSADYLLGKSDQRKIPKQDKKFIAFYNGYKDMDSADQKMLDDMFNLIVEKNKNKKKE